MGKNLSRGWGIEGVSLSPKTCNNAAACGRPVRTRTLWYDLRYEFNATIEYAYAGHRMDKLIISGRDSRMLL